MGLKKIVVLLIFAGVVLTCTHDPYPAPPPGAGGNGNGNDTINNPGDTTGTNPCDPDTVYFQQEVLPILNASCAYSGCHDAGTAADGVVLNNYSNIMNTADVRAGNPNGSDLYESLVETDPDKVMPPPPNNSLEQEQIDLIRKWINQGAQNLSCSKCDTTGLTYQKGISQIFNQNCVTCHSGTAPRAGRSLTNYAEAKDALLNTNLLQRINGEPGVSVMPQGGKMRQCNIKSIEIWYANGMPQ